MWSMFMAHKFSIYQFYSFVLANKRLIELSKPRRTQSDSKLKEPNRLGRSRNNKASVAKQEATKLKKRFRYFSVERFFTKIN